MRKLFAITAILLLALSSVCFAEKQEWVDKNYDFSKVKAVLLWDMFVDKSLENGINEKEIIEIVREKTNIKYVKGVTPPVVMEAIKRDYGIDLEALKATNQDQVLTTFFKYLPNYVDLEISVKVFSYGYGSHYREGYSYNTTSYKTSYTTGMGGRMETIQTPVVETHHVPGGNAKVTYCGVRWDIMEINKRNAVWSRIDDRARETDEIENTKPKDMLERIIRSFYDDFNKKTKRDKTIM